MATQTSVIQQVAEAECAEVRRLGREHIPGDRCQPCASISGGNGGDSRVGLMWPILSRGCHTIHPFVDEAPPCPECGGNRENPGRVPDVTLEKVLALLLHVGRISILPSSGPLNIIVVWQVPCEHGWGCDIEASHTLFTEAMISGESTTDRWWDDYELAMKEAACAALLATLEN